MLNMPILTLNKHCSNLKALYLLMPNFLYCHPLNSNNKSASHKISVIF